MGEVINQWPVVIAAVLSFGAVLVHFFAGGRAIAGPLRRADGVSHTVMATMWMCWHMVTAILCLMGVFFVMGLFAGPPYVVAGTLLAATFAGAGLVAVPVLGTSFKILPQGWLFVPILGLGLFALLI
jgi:hypothetical protein